MQQLIDTYSQLMTSLSTLPDEIAGYQEDLTSARMRLAETKKDVERIEAGIVAEAGGWKAIGNNEKEREMALPALFRKSGAWTAINAQLSTLARTVAEMSDELAAAERQYGAVCYMAKLHGALLSYLGNAGAPVGNVVFTTPTGMGKTTNGFTGAATVADAAELGL